MELTCKTCQSKFSSVRSFVTHFNLTHRLSSSARFTCGVKSCLVRFLTEERFESHVRECHTSPQSSVPTDNESSCQFVCPMSNCNYTCNVKSTMRVHRKRKHGQESCAGSAVEEPHTVLLTADLDSSEVSDFLLQDNSENSAEETINNIIFPEQERDCKVSRQDVLQNVVHFYMTLNSKYHVPDSTIQYMISNFFSVTSASNSILKEDIISSLKVANIEFDQHIENAITSALSNNILLEVHDSKGPLRSSYMRQKTYRSGMFKYVAPTPHKLGLNDLNEKRKYHTISVKASLEAMFEDDSVYEQYLQSQNSDCSQDGFIRDIHDGTLLKNHPVLSKDKSAIGIMLDADDLEIASALGSARGKHKVTAVYYTLTNFLPWSRMKQDVIRLCMIAAEKDVAYFGLEKVLKPLITELKELAETGIEIRGKTVKVVLTMLLGDNLGTHTWTGLVENFSRSKFFCRYCEQSRDEWCTRWHGNVDDEDSDSDVESSGSSEEESDSSDNESCEEEVEVVRESTSNVSLDFGRWNNAPMPSAPLRTPQSVDLCLAELQSKKSLDSVKGVVGPCQLNKLKDFHWVGASPCCFAHDWFEGVLSHDCALALQYFKSRFGVDAKFINSKIKSLKLLGSDQGNKPAKVKDGMKKLRGGAVQNWNFLRFLPFFIASKITDTNDGVWQMVLHMADLTRFLSSPTACRSELPRLRRKVHLYLKMRCFHFPNVRLRCKHHYLEHAAHMIECFGCLMRINSTPWALNLSIAF